MKLFYNKFYSDNPKGNKLNQTNDEPKWVVELDDNVHGWYVGIIALALAAYTNK